jgi:HSP20 family protein
MLSRFYDLDRPNLRPFFALDGFLRDVAEAERTARPAPRNPTFEVHGAEGAIELVAEVPGLSEKDITVTLDKGTLLVEAGRDEKPAEGARKHGYRFARRFTLPTDVDADAVTATVKDGILTITMPKAKSAAARQIPVKASLRETRKTGRGGRRDGPRRVGCSA